MSGTLVGGSIPKASMILNTGAKTWELNIVLNKAFMIERLHDRKYVYRILVPQKIGCNFGLFRNMSNNNINYTHYAESSHISVEKVDCVAVGTDSQHLPIWSVVEDIYQINAYIELDNPDEARGTENKLGCFNVFTLSVIIRDGADFCNVAFCIEGILYVPCGQAVEGCDRFPLYINYASESDVDGSQTTHNALDITNATTLCFTECTTVNE